jgi:hypothetical protein
LGSPSPSEKSMTLTLALKFAGCVVLLIAAFGIRT